MDIRVYGRAEAEATEHEVPHIMVSISLPGDPNGTAKLRTNKHTLGVLQLTFWDLDRLVPVDPDLVEEVRKVSGITYEMEQQLFEPRHARAILAFIQTYPEAERIICHCDAGLSRSPGVAAALSKILLGDDDYFFKRHSGLNRRVYMGHFKNRRDNIRYTDQNIDFMVLYVIDKKAIAYVPITEIEGYTEGFSLRFDAPKNGQKKHIRYFQDYVNLSVVQLEKTPPCEGGDSRFESGQGG